MAKHRTKWSVKTYHKRINEGRGQGTLDNYKPWITIHDLASQGIVSRVLGLKTGRIHHLLSRNETAYFLILDSSDKVLDIREQFPLLGIDETVRLARQAGIPHPTDKVSLYPYVLTSDFVITTVDGICVRSVKSSDQFADKRVREKLEIERRYWAERCIDWKIVTEKQIDFQKARNLEWLRKSIYLEEMLPHPAGKDDILVFFLELYNCSHMSVSEIARRTEDEFSLERGLGLVVFQRLVMDGCICLDIGKPMDIVSKRAGHVGRYDSWMRIYA